MSPRTHHRSSRVGRVRAPRTPPRLERWAAKAERRELLTATAKCSRLVSYHRCQGEARASIGAHVEASVGSLCTDKKPPLSADMQRDSDRLERPIWSVPVYWARRPSCPEATGDQGCQGYSWPPKASRILFVNTGTSSRASGVIARHAAKPGDVSAEGRSLRSSPSTGEPCTWRREAVDRTGATSPGKPTYVVLEGLGLRLRSKRRARTPSGMVVQTHSEPARRCLPGTSRARTSGREPPAPGSMSMESPVRIERRTPGSAKGARKPTQR